MNKTGQAAEAIAADYLRRYRLRVVATNYHCRFGEIDIIAEEDRVMVFVEVRCRHSYKAAVDSITAAKRRRVQLAAQHYLAVVCGGERVCRFDVMLVNHHRQVEWIKGAFEADY